jgi:hypothetical protein
LEDFLDEFNAEEENGEKDISDNEADNNLSIINPKQE